MSNNQPELHLIVLWQNARSKEKQILEDIQKNLTILECFDIAWNKKNIAKNFTRFYGVKLDNNSKKQQECGDGRFLLITVLDKQPNYEYVETSRGHEKVNVNIFNLKEKYRKLTGGGSKIHATNSVIETNHDITLLLGKNYDDYLKTAPDKWNKKYQPLNQDLLGTNGFASLEEVFYLLNNTTNYVVLRNYECLPKEFTTKEHGDIDILAAEYLNTMLLLNAIPATATPNRVHCYNIVNQQKVFWDIRHIGDNYYHKAWQEDMLSSKVLNNNNIYVLNDENYFYSLIYHAVIHKKKIASDYYTKVACLLKRIFPNTTSDKEKFPFDNYYQMLRSFMADKHYIFTRPKDQTVYYNHQLVDSDTVINYLHNNYELQDVKPIMINNYGASGYTYFEGYKGSERLFIKWGGIENTCKNEFKFTKLLYDINQNNFIKPWFYRCDKDRKFIAMEFINGDNLQSLIANNQLTDKQKDDIIKQFDDIIVTLFEAKCVHRDIRPENFILDYNGKLKLIDNQFAVNALKYKENRFFRKNYALIQGLGAQYALGKFRWDDVYSFIKIAEYIGNTSKDQLNKMRENIGKYRLCFPILSLIKIRFLRCLALFTPVKSWRKKLRGHYQTMK